MNRIAWFSGLTGLGLVVIGSALYIQQRKKGQQLQNFGRLSTRRYAEAPVISERLSGGIKTQLRKADNMPIEQRLATIQRYVREGVQDGQMRKIALNVTKDCPERDGLCEAKAIYDFVKRKVRYTGDIAPIQWEDGSIEGVDLYQTGARTLEMGGGDCLPLSTLVLKDDYTLVPLIELDPGDRIMGNGAWTTVQERWMTGDKETLAFELSNGCTLRCTPEHRIFRNVHGRLEEIRASEARIGDDLVTINSIPTETHTPGSDIYNKLLEDIRSQHSIHKAASRQVALHLRVLYRMLGQNVHIERAKTAHGYPTYCVTPRLPGDDRRDVKFARIRSITNGGIETCMDLTTDQGKFWLPESDTLVHNCDDQSILVATLLALNGITPRLRVMKERKKEDFVHIYPLAGLDKFNPTRWVPLDTTLPGQKFGVEVPAAEILDFHA